MISNAECSRAVRRGVSLKPRAGGTGERSLATGAMAARYTRPRSVDGRRCSGAVRLRLESKGSSMKSLHAWLASGLALAAAAPASSQGLIHHWTDATPGAQFGAVVESVADLDGDGSSEIVYSAPTNGTPAAWVDVRSGKTGAPLFHLLYSGPWLGAYFGRSLASAGDVDADGMVDLVIGTGTAGPHAPAGAVQVRSGANGSALLNLAPYGQETSADFGFAVSGIGDVDADGFDDVLVGVPNLLLNGKRGAVEIYSSAAVALLHQSLLGPNLFSLSNATSLDAMGDVDQDAVPDFVVNQGALAQVRSGATGAVLASATAGAPYYANVAGAGDLTGDGVSEFVVGAQWITTSDPPGSHRTVKCVDGATSQPLFVKDAPLFQPAAGGSGQFGSAIATRGDTDGDGCADIAVGNLGFDGGSIGTTLALVYSGRTHALFDAYVAPGSLPNPFRPSSMALVEDLDVAATDELVLGMASQQTVDVYSLAGRRAQMYGGSCGGTSGFAPALQFDVSSGIPSSISMQIAGGPQNGAGFLLVGLEPAQVKLPNGCYAYVPLTGSFVLPIALSPLGALSGTWPTALVPPGVYFVQTFLANPAIPSAILTSNGSTLRVF